MRKKSLTSAWGRSTSSTKKTPEHPVNNMPNEVAEVAEAAEAAPEVAVPAERAEAAEAAAVAVAFRGELAASFARRATRRESHIDHPASPARRPGCGRDLICSWTLRPSHAFWMGVRTANPKQPTDIRELVDSPIDERSLPIDLVRPDRTVLVAGCVGSRTPCASASAQRAARKSPKRVPLSSIDRLLLVGLYGLLPGCSML